MTPNKHTRYYRTKLSDEQKLIYKDILSSLYHYQSEIKIISKSEVDIVSKIIDYILLDNPEIFYVDNKISYSYNSDYIIINLNFLYNIPTINDMNRCIKDKTQTILKKLENKSYTDFEKEKKTS